jgi:hypothetical protein
MRRLGRRVSEEEFMYSKNLVGIRSTVKVSNG